MRRWIQAYVLAASLAAWGCQSGDPEAGRTGAPAATPFARDFERICHSMERSGANQRHEDERPVAIAMWLGANIESQEGRDFLARFNRTGAGERAAMLEAEMKRLGMTSCPLIEMWSGPPPGKPE